MVATDDPIHIGPNKIEFVGVNIITNLPGPGNLRVIASPNHREEDIARAHSLGYHGRHATYNMSRDHEIAHSLVAHWCGQQYSPTLFGVATGQIWPHWQKEESLVLGLQAYCLSIGTTVEQIARALK